MKKLTTTSGPATRPVQDLPLVLYVEDEEENWDVTQARLRDRYRLLWAKTDKEACDLVRLHGSKLHAILMDIQLKGSQIDGIRLAQVFSAGKADSGPLPDYARGFADLKVPVIFVTAYGARYSASDLALAGGSATVTKPVDFLRLNLALASVRAQSVIQMLDH